MSGKYNKEKVAELINGGLTGHEMMANEIDRLEAEVRASQKRTETAQDMAKMLATRVSDLETELAKYKECVDTGKALVDCGRNSQSLVGT